MIKNQSLTGQINWVCNYDCPSCGLRASSRPKSDISKSLIVLAINLVSLTSNLRNSNTSWSRASMILSAWELCLRRAFSWYSRSSVPFFFNRFKSPIKSISKEMIRWECSFNRLSISCWSKRGIGILKGRNCNSMKGPTLPRNAAQYHIMNEDFNQPSRAYSCPVQSFSGRVAHPFAAFSVDIFSLLNDTTPICNSWGTGPHFFGAFAPPGIRPFR